MMAASQVEGATLLRMMLLGTCFNRDMSVVIQGEDKSLESSPHLEQDVRDEEREESDVVIMARHVQRLCHALYLCVANVGAVEEREPGGSQVNIHADCVCAEATLISKLQHT
jgi:hypothetical protein